MIRFLPCRVKVAVRPLGAKSMKIKIKQGTSAPSENDFQGLKNAIWLLPEGVKSGRWPKIGFIEAIRGRFARLPGGVSQAGVHSLDLPSGTRVTSAVLDDELSAFERLSLARKLAAPHVEENPAEIAIILTGLKNNAASAMAEALLAALATAAAAMPSYKKDRPPASRLRTLVIYGLKQPLDGKRGLAEAEGNALARNLTMLPPNELTPGEYRKRAQALARKQGWQAEFLNMAALAKQGAGTFLAVAQGSPDRDAGILRLRYKAPGKGTRKTLALVGKGICFDTGGTNLKPAQYMHGMHEDMEGSAVALGTLLALSTLKVDFDIDCWLALAQNHIGPKAYKQNDVITALDGTSIEVMHTDAEGRMVLADTLTLAARAKPDLIIDYATLTGACVRALGSIYSGAFSNRESLYAKVIEAGKSSGERVWPFPMDKDYDEELKSDIADIKQCTLEGGPDHILAARFLQRFTNDTPWLHIDLSAGNHKGGLGHVPTSTTGFGTRFTLNLLLEQGVI